MKKSLLVAVILLSSIVSMSAIPYFELPARVFGVIAKMAVEPKAETAAPQAVHLSQDFNSSTSVADYVSATPSISQFDAISSSGAGTVVSINASELQFARTGNAGSFTRSTDFSPAPFSLRISFDLTVTGNSAQTTAAAFTVGSGFDTTNSGPASANVHSRVGLNFSGTNGAFSLRNITNSTNSAEFAGKQRVTWFISNLPGAISINTPEGTLGNLGGDSALVYVGATQVLSIPALTATQTLTDFKFALTQGTGTVRIDNIAVEDIPALANLPDWANLQWPPAFSGTGGQQSETILGQIWEPGVTDAPGQGAGITAQVGYGPVGSDPRANPNWVFTTAMFNADAGNNDEYQGTFSLPNPASTTQYSYTYRYSLDGGANWLYADLDGNGETGGVSFSTAQMGTMTVAHAPAPVISVSGGPLNFGNQAVNTTSASQSITISNNGDGNLVLESPGFQSVTPQFAFVDDPKNVIIAPAESKNFAITFTPTSAGAKTETVTINSNDMTTSRPTVVLTGTGVDPGQLAWSSNQYGAGEAAGTVALTVERTGGTFGAVTAAWALADDASAIGGADCSTAGVDYISAGGTVSFADGETSKQITVTICNDSLSEGNEGFRAFLSDPTGGATIGSPSGTLVGIEDDEGRTFVVDVLSDDGGYEFCEPNVAADCSLRGVLGSVRDGDTITFDSTLFNSASLSPETMQTITLTNGEFVINADITITGPGASQLTIDAGGLSRIFNVSAGTDVDISGMTLTGGSFSGPNVGGGAIYVNDTANLTLTGMTISNNTSSSKGGGIFSGLNSVLTITNSVISDNTAGMNAGGIGTEGQLTISGSTISGNTAGADGGGINAFGTATVDITNSVLSGNSAVRGGGYQGNFALNLTNSTVSGNTASTSGGGLRSFRTHVTGSTFTDNCVGARGVGGVCTPGGQGGAIETTGDVMTVRNSTFSNNSAAIGGGIYYLWAGDGSGVISSTFVNSTVSVDGLDLGLSLPMSNTIVSGGGCAGVAGGLVADGGFNLDSGNTCGFTQPTSKVNTDPMLGPLQDNGGLTWTMAILPNSPAMDAGSAFGLTTDQRGMTKPVDHASIANAGDGSDIGAFEVQVPTAARASITGRVTTARGSSISGAVITVSGMDGTPRNAYTNALGYYRIEGLTVGESFVLAVSARRYTFASPVQFVNLQNNLSGLNFTASQ